MEARKRRLQTWRRTGIMENSDRRNLYSR